MHEGRPLLADFGIALAVGSAGGARLTETGLSVGTPYYMSPEQATGDQIVGPASDIYALACVLYEMLVGEPPYGGATAQAVLGKIIAGGPVSATEQRRSIPAHVDAAIRKALEKLSADRFGSAQEFATALADPTFRHGQDAEAAMGRASSRVAQVMTAVAALFALAFAWSMTRPGPTESVTRLSVRMPSDQVFPGSMFFDLSQDGQVMVYLGPGETGNRRLWVRRLDALDATPILGTEGSTQPAISPDGQEVAFDSPEGLRIVPIQGGVSRTLGMTDTVSSRIRWGPEGEWVYFEFSAEDALYRVPASGGPPELVAQIDTSTTGNMYFDVLPTGTAAVMEISTLNAGVVSPSIHSVDFETGEVTLLVDGQFPRYANGYLLFGSVDGTTLMSAPFDMNRLELTGPSTPIAEGLQGPAGGWNFFAASATGTLVYAIGAPISTEVEIVSVSRDGLSTSIDPDFHFDPGNNNRGLSLSPDGTRLAITITEAGNEDIWVKDLPRGPRTRVSFSSNWDVRPRWAPDGQTLMFLSAFGEGNGDLRVVSKRASGTGDPVQIMDHELPFFEALYSPDMEWVIARSGGTIGGIGGRDVWAMRPGTDTVPAPLVVTDFDEKAIDLSPDGSWLLYESDETGSNEVYVRPFPNVDDDKVTISIAGGVMPRWSHGGGEIFYVNAAAEMVVAAVETEPAFRVLDRTTLFPLPPGILFRQSEQYALYDLTPDDDAFIMLRAWGAEVSDAELIYVDNWMAELSGR
jgi:eukaryotic-like serine/threonine-protein kinase